MLAATLTTVVVFFPVFFLYGVSRYLFIALAVAVMLSLFASYIVALTVVPSFCAKFIKSAEVEHHHGDAPPKGVMARFRHWFNHQFNAMLDGYDRLLGKTLKTPKLTCVAILGLFVASLALYPLLGEAYFPRTDPGQFVINVKTTGGSNLETSNAIIAKVEDIAREEVRPEDLDLVLSNIGTTPDISAIYTSNSGMNTAFVQVNLKEGHRIGSYEYMDRVRKRLKKEVPEVSAYFQTGGLVDAVLNLGLPAPIDLQITGKNLRGIHALATEIARKVRKESSVSDVLVPQDVDYPSLRLVIDRRRAAELGLSQKEIMSNVITVLTSNGMIAPSFWSDPKSGNDYLLTIQYKEGYIKNLTRMTCWRFRCMATIRPTPPGWMRSAPSSVKILRRKWTTTSCARWWMSMWQPPRRIYLRRMLR